MTIPLREEIKASKISIDFYIRPNDTLELDQILLLGKQGTVLEAFDFRTSQKKKWRIFNAKNVGQYQIDERGLEELEQGKLASEAGVQFKQDLRKQLSPLQGIIYWDRADFNQALQEVMNPKADRDQGKYLRDVFRRPILRQTDFFAEENIVLESRSLTLEHIHTIQIRARVSFPFHQTWFFGQ